MPTIFAATSAEAEGGVMYGPEGFCELKGQPTLARIQDHAMDRETAARLWEVSERLTGVSLDPFRPSDYAVSAGGTVPGRGSIGTSFASPLTCSNSAAAWSASSSRRGGATTWRPTGRPN